MTTGGDATCPSGRCREGAVLIGIVGGDGRLGHVNPAVPINAEFMTAVENGRAAESRFRFGEPCAEGDCGHWRGSQCGLIDGLLASPIGTEAVEASQQEPLPRCGIRASCRWFRQHGRTSCGICPLVVHTPRRPHTGDVNPS